METLTREAPAEPRVPTDPGALTLELLTAFIGRLHPGASVTAAEVKDVVGEGEVSTAGRVRLRLTYGAGSPPLPRDVICKMIIHDMQRTPGCMYETEVNMYVRRLPGIGLELPVCLAATYEAGTENFILILEDLSQHGARFTNVLKPPLTPDEIGRLIDELAKLHARYWQSPDLARESAWLGTQIRGGWFDFCDKMVVPLTDMNIAAHTYRADLMTRIGVTPQRLWDAVKAVHRHQTETMPSTLIHGDAGAHNSFRLPDGRCGFLDWQLSLAAPWPQDLQYLIATGLSVEDRRTHERGLIERYLRRLQALGVDYDPGVDEAMAQYTLAILWGLDVGWGIAQAGYYTTELITSNLERLFAACQDHDVIRRAEALI